MTATNPLMNNYARLPVSFVRGEGAYLYDSAGRRYLDALSGIAVCGLGHAHPELAAVLADQAQTLWHVSNLFEIPEQTEAAGILTRLTGMDKAMFCNSGTEANEAALKLSRLHAREKGIDNPQVISFYGGFHGRTFGAMAAAANPKIRQHFQPHLPDFLHLPFNDIAALEAQRHNPRVTAVILECIQGEGGIRQAKPEFIRAVRQLCDKAGWLMICDEVQAGMARSGRWFSYQHFDVTPDVVTLAKGLGSGLPVGACLARGAAAGYFQPGLHGTTFGGTPLVMRVVLKTLEIYQRDSLPAHAEKIGEYLKNRLSARLKDFANIQEIRGQGFLIGIELTAPIAGLPEKALHNGLILNVTAGKTIRLLPPLILTENQADDIADLLAQTLGQASAAC